MAKQPDEAPVSPRKMPRSDADLAPFSAPTTLKIAILLPNRPRLRRIRRAIALANAFLAAKPTVDASISIAFGLAQPDERLWRRAEAWIQRDVPGAVVRHLEWTPVPVDNARRMFGDLDPTLDLDAIEHVIVPRDWGWNFQDCDLWINFADPGLGAILPLRPTTTYCGDLVERYVPAIVATDIGESYWDRQTDAFRLWRQGLIITSDPATAIDVTSYAGVRRERIELIPDALDGAFVPSPNHSGRTSKSLVWHLKDDPSDDLETALNGLLIYRRSGGTLQIVIAREADTGVLISQRQLPDDLQALLSGLPSMRYRSIEEFHRALQLHAALWSSQIASGETEIAHDVVRTDLYWLAPDYPQSRADVDKTGVPAILYPRDEPLAVADALTQLQQRLSDPQHYEETPRPGHDREEANAAFGFLIDRMLELRRA